MQKKQIANSGLVRSAQQRTEQVKEKILCALTTMEKEIASHNGVYPLNGGVVNQSEVCRRAGIRKTTLAGVVHRKTTKVHVDEWVAKWGKKTKAQVKQVVTERAEFWKAEHHKVVEQIMLYELQLNELEGEIRRLKEQNATLLEQLTKFSERTVINLSKNRT